MTRHLLGQILGVGKLLTDLAWRGRVLVSNGVFLAVAVPSVFSPIHLVANSRELGGGVYVVVDPVKVIQTLLPVEVKVMVTFGTMPTTAVVKSVVSAVMVL